MKKREKSVDEILREFYEKNGIDSSLVHDDLELSRFGTRVYFALFPFCASEFGTGTMEEETSPDITHGKLVQMIRKRIGK